MAKAVTAITGMCAQVVVVLQPLRDLEARDFRQLDVHQNEIGPVRSAQIHRLDPAAGLHDPVPARLDEIVEELHVELVVFDDEHGLRLGLSTERFRPACRTT